ncbi:hypothetical protein BJ684DRAFT_15179 [Piptocephalis cylindrospora]|uniref:Anaphase-promoting complex subunit 4-like WD40 domain-containing protein n=1 Tax=Piptocephalis cylindrospora TaxID=1907219 RepID=A0A4P9Y660_9FUNG|nr:hypothetical protein BJ684DRAFT_15179 [Piptocephalis cylindrospora]|eukprot:RKP14507.1 hypothetical protein BJ684DRAFT_15179 [Piptocephalis cylindrospora]
MSAVLSNPQPLTRIITGGSQWLFACYGPDFVVVNLEKKEVVAATSPAQPESIGEAASSESQEGKMTQALSTLPTSARILPARPTSLIQTLQYSPARDLLVTVSEDKSLAIWDATQDWAQVFTGITAKRVNDLVFSPDGAYLYIADKFGDVYRLDTHTWSGLQDPFVGQVSMTTSLALTPSHDLVIGDRDEKIRVCSAERQGDILGFCLGHTKYVSSVHSLSHGPLNKSFLSGGGDPFLLRWASSPPYACLERIPLPKVDSEDEDEEEGGVARILSSKSGLVIVSNKNSSSLHILEIREGAGYALKETISLPTVIADISQDPVSASLLWILLGPTSDAPAGKLVSLSLTTEPLGALETSTLLDDVLYPTFVGRVEATDFHKHSSEAKDRKRLKTSKDTTE